MKTTSILRRVTVLFLGLSLIAPVGARAAGTGPGPDFGQIQTSQGSLSDATLRAMNESGGDPGTWDGSTNCPNGATPFITGIVRDASNNPVAGAQVNVTVLGMTFPNPGVSGPFEMWETKADGSYSLCSWGEEFSSILSQDQYSSNALLAIASPPRSTSGETQGSRIALMASFQTQSGRQTTPDSPTRSAACLDPTLITPQACRMDFVLGAPLVKAKVKQSNGGAIPNAMTNLEYFYRPANPSLTEEQKNAQGKWVQLGIIPTNSTGDFGLSGFTSSNKFRLKVQAPECYSQNGQQCEFDGLASKSDNFTVTVTDPANFLTTGSAAWDLNSQATRDFTLVPANLRAQITNGIGNDLYDIVNVNLTKDGTSFTESSQYGGRVALNLSDGAWTAEVVAPSTGVIGSNATYAITVAAGAVTSISRTSAPVATICSDSTECLTNLKLSLTPPNFLFVVKDSDGTVVEGADMSLDEYTASGGQIGMYPWTNLGGQRSGVAEYGQTAGLGGFSLSAGKIYKIYLNPPWKGSSSDLVRTEYFLKVSEDGTEVRRCATWTGNPQVSPCQFGWKGNLSDSANLLTRTDGKYSLTMSVANFRGFVCAPGSGSSCTTVPYSNVDVQRWQTNNCEGCTGGWYQGIGMYAWAGDTGSIALSFTTEGRYKIEVQPPNRMEGSDSTLYAKNDIEFYADEVNGEWTYYTLDANGIATTTELSTATVGASTRIALRLKTPSFIGIVQSPGGVGNNYSHVELRKEGSGQCPTCTYPLGGTNTDSSGVFALSLQVGKHVMVAHPNPTLEAEGYTRTEFKISALDCDSDGSVEIYTYESSDCSGATLVPTVSGKIVITLQGANFSGVLTVPDSGAAVQSAGVDVEKWLTCTAEVPCGEEGGYWTWAGLNDWTDFNGKFGLRLGEVGKYRVTFRAPSNLQSQYSSTRIEVVVSAGDPLQVVATPDASVFSYNADTGQYLVKLKLPNVSGTVTLPFDGGDEDSANDPAANSWVNAEKWETQFCVEGCYRYSPEANGANTNNSGEYGMTLPAGRWRLTFNPPWSQSGVAKGTREIVVSASGDVCTLANSGSEGTTCPSVKIAAGDLDVELPSPNFSGTVKNPDDSFSQWSSIQFQKWDLNYWQWTNLWANTDNNGKFGINITENGSYRVSFEPSWQAVGVSSKTIFIRVCDNGSVVQLLANETAAKEGSACTESGTLGDPLTVYTLIGANMQGVVFDGSSLTPAALGDAWVAISNCGSGEMNDWCNWERGVNTKGFGDNKGKFALNLSHTSSGNVTKYKIEINPPWNSTAGLVRGQYYVWVKDFVGAVAGDEWCLDTDYAPIAGTCDDARNSDSYPWSVTLTAGNLAGKILAPTGDIGIANGYIQVEKWAQQPWNPTSYYWQWTSYWVNANQTGSFGLNIPGSDAGLFRLTANPGWDNPSGFARRRMYIRVAANDQWCEQAVNPNLMSDETPYGSDGSGEPCAAGSDNAVDSVSGLTVRLSEANLSGILYTSSTDLTSEIDRATASNKVRDAWMSLQVKRTYDWNGSDPGGEWTNWEWLGGSNTSGSATSRGKFGFVIEADGEYRIDVQPSWRDTSGLDGQFYVTFTATGCDDSGFGDVIIGCAMELVGTPNNVVDLTGGNFAVKYPAPNFKGTVKDKSGQNSIAGSWLSIYKENWEWVTGLSTGWNGVNVGKFGTKLDDGTYRVEVWPRWDDASSGMRRVITLVIENGVVTTCNPGCERANPGDETDSSLTITLRGENLSGKVYYPGASEGTETYATTTEGIQTPMPWAWAEVRTCGDAAGTQCDWGEEGVAWVDNQGTNEKGLLRLGLDPRVDTDLPYLVTVWPNWSSYSASPLRLLVRVDSLGVATWKYESENTGYVGEGVAFNPDFGRIPPNLTVTVTGVDDQRFVKLFECVEGTNETINGNCDNGGTWVQVISIGTVEVNANEWKASFTLTKAADYKVVVLRTEADALLGNLEDATATFSHDGLASTVLTASVQARPL